MKEDGVLYLCHMLRMVSLVLFQVKAAIHIANLYVILRAYNF